MGSHRRQSKSEIKKTDKLVIITLIYSTQRDLPLKREHVGQIIYLEKDSWLCGSGWPKINYFFGHLPTIFPNCMSLGGSPDILSSPSLKKQMRSPSPSASMVYIRTLLGRKFAALPFFHLLSPKEYLRKDS